MIVEPIATTSLRGDNVATSMGLTWDQWAYARPTFGLTSDMLVQM